MRFLFFFVSIFFLTFSFTFAEVLKVGTIERYPFVIKNGGDLRGFSIDLWKEIAKRNNLSYEFVFYENFSDMLDDLKVGKTDLAVSNISITEKRKKYFDFSYPYYSSGVAVLIPESGAKKTFWRAFKESALLKILIFIFLLFLIFVFSVYKKATKEGVYQKNFNGLRKSFFWSWNYFFGKTSANSFLKIPKRLFLAIFVFFVFLSSTLLISNIQDRIKVSDLKQNIKSVADIHSFRVGVSKGTTMEDFALKHSLSYISYDDFLKALDALETLEVDVVLGDYATSKEYYAKELAERKIKIVGSVLQPDNIAIAFVKNSKYKDLINKSLVDLQKEGLYQKLLKKYFNR